MKKIKSVKHRVKLSYKTSFVFDELEEACAFLELAVRYSEDPEDIEDFVIETIVEFEEEQEKEMIDDKEAIDNEDVHQD